MKAQNFVAVDFETATPDKMICEIGLVVVNNGEITDRFHSIVKPPRYSNVTLRYNHIKPEDWQDSPTFEELWPDIAGYFQGRVVVSHNAPFDQTALENNLKEYNIMKFGIDDFHCSSRYCCGHQLGVACTYFGIDFDEKEHHNALYDAEACAKVAIHLFDGEEIDVERMEAINKEYMELHPKKNSKKRYQEGVELSAGLKKLHKHYQHGISHHLLAEGVDPHDETNPFFGKKIIFTGEFRQNRKAVEKLIRDEMGGTISPTVTKMVNFFFIGEDPGDTKMQAYLKLKHNGFEVPTFYQRDLDEILSGVWEPYRNASKAVKKLDFTYEHFSHHHIEFKEDRNVLAGKEVFLGDRLEGKRQLFDIVLGNLGALDSGDINEETNICILSNETLRDLAAGKKDETILALESFYNNNRSLVFDFSFLSEEDVVDFCFRRCINCGDKLTYGYLQRYLNPLKQR